MEEVKITIGMDAGPAEQNLKRLQADVQQTEQIVERAARSFDVAGNDIEKIIAAITSSAKEGSDQVTKKLDEVAKAFGREKEAADQARAANQEHTVSINDMTDAVSAMPGPVGDTARAFSGLTSTVGKFIKSPLLWFLAAVAAAYQYLTWSLGRTTEGQEKLDEATAKYHQRLENVKDAASAFGRIMYSALDRAAGVADTLLSKLGGIGRMLGSIGGGALGGGIGSAVGGIVGDWVWNRNVDDAASIAARENALWQKRKAFKVEEAELERQISEARAKACDSTLSAAEQEAAVKEAVAATNKLYDKRKEIAEETRDIAVGRLGLSDSDRDAEMAAEQAKADVINLEAQRQNALRFLNRMDNSFDRKFASDAKSAAESAKKALEQRDALFQVEMQQTERQEQQALKASNAQEEARIAAIGDAGERERAERKHQHDLAIQQIEKQADEYRKANYEEAKKTYEAANPGKKYSQTEAGSKGWQGVALTADQDTEITAKLKKQYAEYARITAEYTQKIKDNVRLSKNELARLFGDYADQKMAIIDDANQKIYELEKTLSDKSTDDERESVKNQVEIIKKQLVGELQALDLKYGKIKPLFSDLFEEEANRSVASINKLIAKYQALVDFLKGNNGISRESLISDYGFTEGEIDAAIEKVRKEGVKGIDDFTDALKGLTDEAKKGVEEIKNSFSQFLNAFSGGLSAVEDVTGDYDSTLSGMSGAVSAIQSLMNGDIGGVVRSFDKIAKAIEYEADNHEWSIKQEEAYQTAIDANTHAVEKNTEILNKANGLEAVKASSNLINELTRNLYAVLGQIQTVSNDTGYENALGMSLAHYLDEYGARGNEYWIRTIAEHYGINAWDPNAPRAGRRGNTPVATQGGYTWSALLNNDPKELARIFKDIRENDASLWGIILGNSRDFTGGDLEKYIDELINAYDEIGKAETALFENLNNMTVEEAFSGFLNSLYDLADGSDEVFDDIAANWQKMVNRMVVNNLIGAEMRQALEGWYAELAQLNRERVEGGITDEEFRNRLNVLQQDYDDLVRTGQDKMQSFVDMGIIKPIEEATDAVRDFESEIDTLISSLSDTSSIDEWGRSFKEGIIDQFMQGFLSDEDRSHIKDAMQSISDIMNDTSLTPEMKAAQAQPFIDAIEQYVAGGKDIAQQLRDAFGLTDSEEEELATPFENLKDDILSSLTDLENGAEDFRKSMQSKMIGDVVEKMVLGNEVERQNADGSYTVFDTFNDWLEDWQQRYSDILDDATLSDEEREARLQALVDEAIEVRESEAESAERFAGKLKEIQEIEHDTTFKDMSDEWKSTLLDMTADAESFGNRVKEMMAEKVMESMLEAQGLQAFLDSQQEAINGIFEGDGTWEEKMEAVQVYIDEMVARYEELAPLGEKIRDAFGLTAKQQEAENPFSDLKDSLVNALMDMDSTAESFGKQIGTQLVREMIANIIDTNYGNAIKVQAEALRQAILTGAPAEVAQAQEAMAALYQDVQRETQALRDTQKVIEELNDTTFTGMRDSFRSAIMDMSADGMDFARNITQTITERLVDSLILGDDFDSYLDGLQQQYNAIMHDDSLTAEQKAAQIAVLGQGVTQMAAELQEATKGIFDATGWSGMLAQIDTPLADMRSKFRSTLSDMTSDAGDFAKDITDIMVQDFIDRFVLGDAFDQQLEHWQQEYSKIMSADLSEEERAKQLKQLQQSISNARDTYAEAARGIHELMGTAEYADQSATMNLSDKATYEQMDQYLGTNMGILMAAEQGNQVRQQILATLQQMNGLTSPGSSELAEIRGFMAIGNEYLLDIKRSNREILTQFGQKLDSIDSKLNRVL